MARLLWGKPVEDALARDMAPRVQAVFEQGIVPTLAIVRMGARPDDLSYERTAMKLASELGIVVRPYVLVEGAPQKVVRAMLESINADSTVHGCLMLRPLPPTIDEDAMCELLNPHKDVDGITPTSLVSVFTDRDVGFPPCTAAACLRVLDYYGVPLEGRHAVVVGRSLVVGKPVAMMLMQRNATVTIAHSRTQGLAELCREADVVVCATGRARAFGPECFRAGQTVLDVGINFDADGQLCGDVDFERVEPLVDSITPVPRGIGGVTTSEMMTHVVEAAEIAAASLG